MGDARANGGNGATPAGWNARLIALLAALVLVPLLMWHLDVGRRLAGLRGWIAGLGAAGPGVFILLRAGAAVALIPGSALSASAGALFGPVPGIVCVSVGKTIGAAVACLIARYGARDAVAERLAGNAHYRRLDALMARRGALVVALTRLIPAVPFNVQNYAYGLTAIPFGVYVFWSWLCMLPSAVFVVSGMNVVAQTLESSRVPWGLLIVFCVTSLVMLGLAIAAAVVFWRDVKDLRGEE